MKGIDKANLNCGEIGGKSSTFKMMKCRLGIDDL